ncbi:MAG: hypothetical protein WBB43_03845, partial [Limnoraphis sp.]
VADMDNKQDIFKITGEEVGGFGNDTIKGFEKNLDKIEFGFDILLSRHSQSEKDSELPPQIDKNFEVLNREPNTGKSLDYLDFPFIQQMGNDLLIMLPASGEISLDGEGIQTGTIEYQINGQTEFFGGGTLLIENVNSLTDNDFIFFS